VVHINRKGFVSQNVMAAVDFDMKFVFASVGCEGSANDMKVLRVALERGGFSIPPGRYYLADAGYANTGRFLSPFRGHVYHLRDFEQVARSGRYRSAEDLFNHRHSQLRNIIERAFGVLKNRFKILKIMHPYKFKKQCLVVLACFILHNFIIRQNELQNEGDDILDQELEKQPREDEDEESDEENDPIDIYTGDVLRTTIKNVLWEHMQNRRSNRN
jgi:DDE superfamily endonuclease